MKNSLIPIFFGPPCIQSQMFTIQQINGRKKHHFKFLAISNFPTFTNKQINSDLHVVHYLYDQKCSQFNRTSAEKNTISNFWRLQITQFSQINSVLHIVHYLYDHKCSQFNISTAEKNTISKVFEFTNFPSFTNQQINSFSHIVHYLCDHKC